MLASLCFYVTFSFLKLQCKAVFALFGVIPKLRFTVGAGENLNGEKAIFPCLVGLGDFFAAFGALCHATTIVLLLQET